jgi:hypothetical protein
MIENGSTEKDFYIYTRSKGFHNSEKCNAHSKQLYDIFYQLWKRRNFHFPRVKSIRVTSQDRNSGALSAHYKPDKASDIVIDPPEYMCYYAGILHALTMFNIYLGTVDKDGNRNLHIHSDHDYSKRTNKLYYEKSRDNKIDLYDITKNNIDNLLKVYKFDILDSITDFGIFKSDTIKYLLTNLPESQKLKIYEVTEESLKEKIDRINPAGAVSDWLNKAKIAGVLAAGVWAAYKVLKLYRGK